MPVSKPVGPAEADGGEIRAFVALNLPSQVRRSLEQWVTASAGIWSNLGVRWVKQSNIHLTLRFLGDTSSDRIERLCSALEEVAQCHPPFTACLEGIGAFPSRRQPRIIWVGVQDGNDRIGALKQGVDRLLVPLGWKREKRGFMPHLTLGRIRHPGGGIEGEWPLPPPLEFGFESLDLVQSHLKPTGAEYQTLHRAFFKAQDYGVSD